MLFRSIAFREERTERQQNNSHHSSLPGTDAVPSSSLPGMDAVPSSSSSGTDALPSASSLPGTNALPKITSNHKTILVKEGTSAKDQQKPASQKKKKKPQSTTSRVRFEIHDKFLTFVINFTFRSFRLIFREVVIHRILIKNRNTITRLAAVCIGLIRAKKIAGGARYATSSSIRQLLS